MENSQTRGRNKLTRDDTECVTCRRSSLVPLLLGEGLTAPADCLNPATPPPWLDHKKLRRSDAIMIPVRANYFKPPLLVAGNHNDFPWGNHEPFNATCGRRKQSLTNRQLGQTFFERNLLSVFISNLVGLVCLLAWENILKVLVFTGKSSTVSTSYRRYLSTLNHVRQWYSEDFTDPSSSGFRSLQLVRRVHSISHKSAIGKQVAVTSQTDMVITQWAFFGLVITHAPQLGINFTHEDEEGLVHFWRAIGYYLGIEDKYNLCAGSVEDVRINCHALLHQALVPAMANPPSQFTAMCDTLLQGVHKIVTVVHPPSFKKYVHHLLEMDDESDDDGDTYGRMMFNLKVYNFGTVLHVPIIGPLLRNIENNLLRFALYMNNTWPVVTHCCSWTEKTLFSLWQSLAKYSLKIMKGALIVCNYQRA